MVVRRRVRAILTPLALYCGAAAASAYFLHHAHHGLRGLEAKRQLKLEVHETAHELDNLKAERAEWERRLTLLRSDQIDRDLLEERARTSLGRVHRSDLVIITGE